VATLLQQPKNNLGGNFQKFKWGLNFFGAKILNLQLLNQWWKLNHDPLNG